MNWFVGFVMGMIVAGAYTRIMEHHEASKQIDAQTDLNVDSVLQAYKRGRTDALSTNPVSFELEEKCLQIWANRQPTH